MSKSHLMEAHNPAGANLFRRVPERHNRIALVKKEIASNDCIK
jgi:hypothetical protein